MFIELLFGIPFFALVVGLLVGPAVVAAARRRRPVVDVAPETILDVFFDPGVSRAEAVARTAAHDGARVRWTGEAGRAFEGEQSVMWLSFRPTRRDGAASSRLVAAEFPLSHRARLLALPPRAQVTIEGSLRLSTDGDGVDLVAAVFTRVAGTGAEAGTPGAAAVTGEVGATAEGDRRGRQRGRDPA